MFKPLAVAMSATCLAFAASANPASPDSVSGLLQGMDSTDVVIEWIDDSTARVDATRNGYNFTVRLMDCDESKKCKSSLTFATFDMDGTPDIGEFQKINDYNDSYPFGRAFLIGDPDTEGYMVGIDYSISLADENDYGQQEVSLFFIILDSFITHMQADS